jgi:hypothetical protein
MEIENDQDNIDINKISEEIFSIHPSRKTLINNLHSLILQFQAHLDIIIKRYKVMSITLVAATIAAVGFSFSSELSNVPVNKLVIACIICIFGLIGVCAIWHLDIQVFHKFWGSFFVEEINMEESHAFLVDVGDIDISLDNIKARLTGDGNWYIFLNIVLLAVIATILSFIWKSFLIKCSIFFLAGILAFCIANYMILTSRKLLDVVKKLVKLK